MQTISRRDDDCVICAYSSCAGLSWKQSKQKLKKHLASRKRLGAWAISFIKNPIDDLEVIAEGSYKTIAKMFGYKRGILFVSFGNGKGHCVYWDGFKFLDNNYLGRFNNKTYLHGVLEENECINLVLRYRKTSVICIIKSFFYDLFNLIYR